jgi:hypothetical protein
VYFSNAYDEGSLYSMTPSETDITKLNSSNVRNILAGGEYLYYFQMGATGDSGFGSVRIPRSFNRSDLNGKNIESITRDTVVTGQLVNNYLYLLVSGDDEPSFYKIKIDKTGQETLASYIVNPACAVNGHIYYNGTQEDHFLYSLDTSNDSTSEILEGNIWYPSVDGNYVYYIDLDNNYRLCRYSMSENVTEVLGNDRVDYFNEAYGYIYYQTSGSNPQLKCMSADGSGDTVVADGVYNSINITSQYVYYREYENDTQWFHIRLGSNYGEEFYAAQNAVTD